MESRQETQHPVYSNNVIEFVTVAAEYCAFVEKCENTSPRVFFETITKILPLLYVKTTLLPELEPSSFEELEQFVTEDDYNFVNERIAGVTGQFDEYLEVFHPDMKYSDTPIVAHISEDLSDIYQDLKDMIANFQKAEIDIMNDALYYCMENFKEIWGQKLLNAMKAMHDVLYSGADLDDNDDETQQENYDDELF